MKILILIAAFFSIALIGNSQVMTPELLWQLNRVKPVGISDDGRQLIFKVDRYDISSNSKSTRIFQVPIEGGEAIEMEDYTNIFTDPKLSPDGTYKIEPENVKVIPVSGKDYYPDLKKSNVYIYDNLMYRHWDEWEDGEFSHLFLRNLKSGEEIDIMKGEPNDCPMKPFGGEEDFIWNNEGTKILYVTKKAFGKEYAISTNTDIYAYDLTSKSTINLTSENQGYDNHPAFSSDGTLAWLQMDEPGYEADKNDIIISRDDEHINLTGHWDGTVEEFHWSLDGKNIYFTAATGGTIQLFAVNVPKKGQPKIKQITDGQFDVTGIIGESKNQIFVTRTDMNHATEIYSTDVKSGGMMQISHANDSIYEKINLSKLERRMTTTTDGKKMVTWVIYPPEFDPSKKYPALLYCEGGPQSPLTQFYSFRWNFQLMAAHGYIVIAPNRRGMPGHGVEWNEQISGDWGGQNIQDYLSAIDEISQESFVNNNHLGAVGASYGGFSVFTLAGVHENRFKTFIAHDGVFNTRSMYGTTEELFFVNKDFGGPYWENQESKSYNEYNPITMVNKWDTPILIFQGGKDYRVPIGQGLEAFQAAQLRGLKSKLLYFPEENHWIQSAQNGIIWQKEFFKWLEETLN
mgnify:CR=1 FL=1